MPVAVPFPPIRHPLVAILRGLKPEEAVEIVSVLIEEGFEAIEIPLNSPDPFRSIEMVARHAPSNCLIGAGTILTVGEVNQLSDAGGRLFVSPNVDVPVLSHAVDLGMVTLPGCFTATEALAAARTGATGLKFFPASVLGPDGISAIRAVLPPDIMIAAVGGVSDKNFSDYAKAGIKAFGLGSSLYKPGMKAPEVRQRARASIAAYEAVFAGDKA